MTAEDKAPSPDDARPRKRTRRACDKCSTARARCDGDCPWLIVMQLLVLCPDTNFLVAVGVGNTGILVNMSVT